MRAFGVFERNAGNRFTIDVQTANRSKIRRSGAPSDFFRQRLRFFAFYTFFPAVGTVEVSDGFIDRLTNCETGRFQTLKIQGGSAPFFRSVSAGLPGRFLRRFFAAIFRLPPSLTLSPPKLLTWLGKNIYISSKLSQDQQKFKFSTTIRKGC